MNDCMCGSGGKDHCAFDHGIHQFYELDGTTLDHCKKCGKHG